MENSPKTLVIRVGDGPGLGDNLFYSHLPRIAKTCDKPFEKVYIHNPWSFRHNDLKRLIWEMNPYVDGVVDDIQSYADIIKNPSFFRGEFADLLIGENLLDRIMLLHNLDDGERFHEPEIYYQPKFREEFHKVVFDPNWISNAGGLSFEDVLELFGAEGIKIEAVMGKKEGGKGGNTQQNLFDYDIDVEYIHTPTLEDFCDLLYSAKAIYCFVTGTATLAAALKKPATVFVGKNVFINPVFFHSKLHRYCIIPKYKIAVNKIMRYKFLGIKGHIRLELDTFERLLKFINEKLPKSMATKISKYINSSFVSTPSRRNKYSKAHYEKLKKEIFIPTRK